MLIPPALRERGIDRVHAWSIPMTTRFRRITERDGLLLHGPEGWAEFSPFWDYDAAESTAWSRAALEDATRPRPAPRAIGSRSTPRSRCSRRCSRRGSRPSAGRGRRR
ncbi:hypothetical protein [Brachybacterium sp. GPGPB12]|uniref:hypothetical protein n=1 Tax=Brachybacterium sp. GPGPB12 TaxID=3023517 RepID=UPI0031344523